MARLEDLQKLRADLLGWVEDAPVDRKAALVAQYRATLEEIEKLTPKEAVGEAIDEIAARRTARRSAPAPGKGRANRSS